MVGVRITKLIMKISYYWCTTKDALNEGRGRMWLLRANYTIKCKLGDRLYINDETGYLGKRKSDNLYFVVKCGKNLTIKENYFLFYKMKNLYYKRVIKGLD